MRTVKRIGLLVALVALALAGCGSAKPKHNDADVAFAQMMVPHHEQAVQIAELAPSHASSSDVRKIAAAIDKAQQPEIETLRAWLKAWGEVEESPYSAHDGSDMSMHMPGMLSERTMTKLEEARGPEFDRLFLTSMIAHHKGAIAMAETEKEDGKFPGAKTLADTIISTQTAEIKRMQKLLKALP